MIHWTGNGALSLVILMLGIGAGAAGTESRDTVFSVVWFMLCMVAASLINQALAFRLNGELTPAGRRWRRDGGPHTLWFIPMQSWTPVPLVFGMGVLAVTVWASVAPWAGIATFLGTVAVWVGAKALWRRGPGRPRAGTMPRPAASGPVPRTTVEPLAPPPGGTPPHRPAGRPDGEPFGSDRPEGPRDWTQTDPAVTWMHPYGSAGEALPEPLVEPLVDDVPVSTPASERGRPAAARPAGRRGSSRWRVLVVVIVVLLIVPAGRTVAYLLAELDSTGTPAPANGGTEPAPDDTGDTAPVRPGWAHAGGSGPARYTIPREANLCARLDRAAMARAFGRPLGDPIPSTEEAAGGSSLLCVLTFVSEPDAGHVRTAVTRVSATFADDAAAAARFYDQTWATASDDHASGEESRDPDGLGQSAFGFAASGGDTGAAARYLVSVLDGNLVLTVEQRVFAPDPIRSTARSRGLARAFDLARETIPRLA